jgi:hypothetical protein
VPVPSVPTLSSSSCNIHTGLTLSFTVISESDNRWHLLE